MQKQKIQVSPDGNLVFNPSRSIDNLMNLNYSTKWRFIPHVDDGKFAILIATPILGYTDLTKKTQIHYFSSYVDAEIKALGQSKYEEYETITNILLNEITASQIFRQPKYKKLIPENSTISLAFLAALGLVQLSVAEDCIDSCITAPLKVDLGLSASENEKKRIRYQKLLTQIIINPNYAPRVYEFLRLTTLQLQSINNKSWAPTVVVLALHLAKYANFKMSLLQKKVYILALELLETLKTNYPQLEKNLEILALEEFDDVREKLERKSDLQEVLGRFSVLPVENHNTPWKNFTSGTDKTYIPYKPAQQYKTIYDQSYRIKLLLNWELNIKVAAGTILSNNLCDPYFRETNPEQPNFFIDSATTLANFFISSLANQLSTDDYYLALSALYSFDHCGNSVYCLPNLNNIQSSDMSSLNAARIITILYFQTLSIVQVSVPENCQAMKTQEKIYTGNEREKIISYTLTSIQTILAQSRFAKIAYEYFKSLKEPYVSPIASNIIKPIILMSLIKLKVKNKLEFTNMNLKKSLNSIKNKIGEILGHYPNLLVNISELTPKAIPSSDIIKKYQRNILSSASQAAHVNGTKFELKMEQ